MVERVSFDGEVFSGREDTKMEQFLAVPGDIVVSKIRARQGSVGLVTSELGNVSVTIHYRVLVPDGERLDTFYAWLALRSSYGRLQFLAATGGAMKGEISEEALLQVKIPLPPLEAQRAIVARWQQAQAEIAAANEQAEQLRNSVAQNAIREAGIVLKPLIKRPAIFALSWSKAERWGVEFNRWDWSPENLLSSADHPMRRLAEIAWINPSDTITLVDSDPVTFVPMAAVSDELGEIVAPEIRLYQEVKSGYTRFAEQDVIWAKITPCMQNGKCAVARNLENGVGCGSTEFHVIRTKDVTRVLSEYLWVILRLRHVREAAQRYFIGSAGQQRVPADFLEELYVPLPPIDIQCAIVRQVEAGRAEVARLREQAAQRARAARAEVEAALLGGGRNDRIC